jgi:hypothetical protein
VALLIVAAAAGVALGQQAARQPLPLLPAMGKLVVAAAIAALTMALLGYAGGGRLGNFGDVGVDQATFGPAAFLWFAGIGALTVAMSGGIARRVKAPIPATEAASEPESDPESESESEPEPEPESEQEPVPEPEEPGPGPDADELAVDEPVADPESDDLDAGPHAPPEPRGTFDDPEEHFVTDDDGTPGTTTDGATDDDD